MALDVTRTARDRMVILYRDARKRLHHGPREGNARRPRTPMRDPTRPTPMFTTPNRQRAGGR